MAANKRFTPRASTNLIEDETANKELGTEVEVTPEDVTIPEEVVTPEEEVTPEEDTTPDKEDTSDEDSGVTFTPTTDKKPIAKMVKIRLAKKFDGCIGGTWYHFAKDQVVNVPENVKRILNSSEGMLKPL